MTLPACVDRRLSKQPLRVVPIGIEDQIIITPEQLVVYRSAGLVQDRQVEAYTYRGQYIDLDRGRRTATIRLAGPGPQSQQLVFPANYTTEVIRGVLTGVLYGDNIIASQPETIRQTEEKTIVVTDSQVLIHDGDSVWGDTFGTYTPEDIKQVTINTGGDQLVIEGDIARHHRRIRGSAETLTTLKQTIDSQSSTTASTDTARRQSKTETAAQTDSDLTELHECLDAIHSELQTLQTLLEETTESPDETAMSRPVSHDQ